MKSITFIPIAEAVRLYSPGEGRHFFDAASMRFFRSRLPQFAYSGPGGIYFVTSEQFVSGSHRKPRAYTVRKLTPHTGEQRGSIDNSSEFNTLTRYAANKIAAQLAAGGFRAIISRVGAA